MLAYAQLTVSIHIIHRRTHARTHARIYIYRERETRARIITISALSYISPHTFYSLFFCPFFNFTLILLIIPFLFPSIFFRHLFPCFHSLISPLSLIHSLPFFISFIFALLSFSFKTST